jgi:uncharacterized protein YdaU (DUF1376 family)
MHFYTFNIGDYRRDTMHLSAMEHGIYRQLLDWYYLEESPIPKITQSVIRRLRLVSEDEQKSLVNVLNDFFVETEKGWVQPKCNEEIAKYHRKSEVNAENGKRGGRPKKPKKTQSVILGNPNETQTKAKQKANSITQELNISITPVVPNSESPEGSGPAGTKKKTDEEWLTDTRALFPGIEVDTELRKMDAWLSTRPGKQKTRRFIVNWLNRVETPVRGVNGSKSPDKSHYADAF